MTSRERVLAAINHQTPDKVPLDLGSTLISGIHVSSLHKLKVSLGLIKDNEPVKVYDPFQMLGEVDDDLRDVLGIDTVPLPSIKISLVLKMKTGNHGLFLMGHRFWFRKSLILCRNRMVTSFNILKAIVRFRLL